MQSSHYSELKWGKVSPPLDGAEECHSSPVRSRGGKDNNFLPLHAEKTALLVVDVQPEYWSQCPAVQKDFPDFPRNLEATVQTCRRQTVAKIIWVRADYRYSHSPWLKQFSRIHSLEDDNKLQRSNFRAEVPCDPASHEFQWEDFATPIGGEVLIPKSSWSSTSNTALMNILRAADVDTVLVCGLITSVCVQHSAFGVFEAGYRTILVTDACADRGKARHDAALALYGDYMYELITSDDLQSSSSPRRLQKAKPLWALTQHSKQDMTESGHHVYSPVLSSELPPPSVTLSASTSTSSLTSSLSNTNTDTCAMPPLQL